MSDANELISFIASMTGEGNLRVEENLGEGYVRLRVSEAERRQARHDIQHVEDIVIEMLRNARDADAKRLYLATSRSDSERTLLFFDDGCGVPVDMHDAIFEARVTSKLESMKMDRWGVHGRGMALFSIRQNVREARVVSSDTGLGSAFVVRADVSVLPERADQSTWPEVEKDDAGAFHLVRGPHNIIRAACAVALDELHGCDVYVGTPTEIAATLYSHANTAVDATQMLFVDDPSVLPVVDRLGLATDAQDFIDIARSIGIEISERTAHRILSGTIKPLRSVTARLLRERTKPSSQKPVDLARDRRGLKISREDIAAFSRAVERDFSELASKYYLSTIADPKVRVGHDRITITFEVAKEE